MKQKSRDAIFKASKKYQYGFVIELCRAHFELYPNDGVILHEYAQALWHLSRYDEAEEALEKAGNHATIMPLECILLERGHLNRRRGDYLQAELWYQKAADLNPRFAGHFVFLGVMAFMRGDLSKAEVVLRLGIACEGDSVDEAYFNLGGVLLAQERYEDALACYQKAIEIDPQYNLAKYRMRDLKKVLEFRAKTKKKKKSSHNN